MRWEMETGTEGTLVSGGLGIELESSSSWVRSLPGATMVGLKGGHTQGSGFPLACSSPS